MILNGMYMTPINALGQHPSGQNWRAQAAKNREEAAGHLRLRQRNGHLGQEAPTLFRNEEALTALGSDTPRSEWGDKEYFADPSKASWS